ncbi:hypothetical protein LZ30DRAFT_826433 [Colletotrichum cereale]|nr:hypothetical protein LZ30DRAFT_826433 [Colletotrichum cereale]
MASNNTPTKQAPCCIVEVDNSVANYIAQLANPTPSEAAILAVHRSNMAAKGNTAAARPGEADAGGPNPGAWPLSPGDVASPLASSGFTDLGTDIRWSTLEPAVRDRLEKAMLLSEDQWRWRDNLFQVRHQEKEARVKELLASQRKHLLAAVEIDHQLREIWPEQQASSDGNGNKVDGA